MALMVALHEEARGILKAGHWKRTPPSASLSVYEGCVGGAQAVLAVSGVGRACAEASVREILEEYRPSAVLSLGFAGGLIAGQRAGDLIVARTLMPARIAPNGRVDPGGGESFTSDRALTAESLRVAATLGLRHQAGACVTASDIVSNPEAKTRLGLITGALAVETESFWIGLACRERNAHFLTVRSVVDTAEDTLPDFAARFASDTGFGGRWWQALPVMLRPSTIPALIRLGNAASLARNSLTAFTVGFMNLRTRGSFCVKPKILS